MRAPASRTAIHRLRALYRCSRCRHFMRAPEGATDDPKWTVGPTGARAIERGCLPRWQFLSREDCPRRKRSDISAKEPTFLRSQRRHPPLCSEGLLAALPTFLLRPNCRRRSPTARFGARRWPPPQTKQCLRSAILQVHYPLRAGRRPRQSGSQNFIAFITDDSFVSLLATERGRTQTISFRKVLPGWQAHGQETLTPRSNDQKPTSARSLSICSERAPGSRRAVRWPAIFPLMKCNSREMIQSPLLKRAIISTGFKPRSLDCHPSPGRFSSPIVATA